MAVTGRGALLQSAWLYRRRSRVRRSSTSYLYLTIQPADVDDTAAIIWADYLFQPVSVGGGDPAPLPIFSSLLAPSSGITGNASLTQAGDSVSASGTVDVIGTLSTSQAGDSTTAAGTVDVVGSLNTTQSGDSLSAAGTSGASDIIGDASLTQADNTVSASGTVDVIGDSALTQASNTVSASGVVDVIGTSTPTQADNTSTAAGTVAIAGSAAITQAGDTLTASGITLPYAVSGISVGIGYSDVSPKQLVRTSTNRLYVAAVNCDSYPGDGTSNKVMMYKADTTALATSFTEKDSASRPSGGIAQWAIAIDSTDTIHIIYNTRASAGGNVTDTRYVTFNTSSDTWGSSVSIDNAVNFSEDSGNQGVESVAIAIDNSDKAHVVYLATDGTRRRMKYRNNTSGSWSSATTVDDQTFASNEKIWHPNLCFDTSGRILTTFHIGTFNDTADGRVYIRTRETSGTWNTTVAVSGANTALTSIDNSGSLYVNENNVYQLSFINASTTPGNKYIRYFYSTDNGVNWTANHPGSGTQATHNPGVGPNGVGGTRITAHGTPDVSNIGQNLYYFSGDGGSATWGSWTLWVTDADAECSVNQRWSQYHHNYPGTLDFIYWHAAYPNDLFYAGEIVIQGAASGTQDANTTTASGTVDVSGTLSTSQAGDTVSATGTVGSVEILGDASLTQAGNTVSASGTVDIIGAFAVTQSDNTAGATGTVDVIGLFSVTQAGDSLTADGVAGSAPATGDANLTQADNTLSASGVVTITADASATQSGDSVSASATVAISGAGSLTQSDDSTSADGGVLVTGQATLTQVGDSLSATGVNEGLPSIQGTITFVFSANKPRVDVDAAQPRIDVRAAMPRIIITKG